VKPAPRVWELRQVLELQVLRQRWSRAVPPRCSPALRGANVTAAVDTGAVLVTVDTGSVGGIGLAAVFD
jgi:hypothetical protein